MELYHQYTQTFKDFAAAAINNNKPSVDLSIEEGTVSHKQCFIQEFGKKLKVLNNLLVTKSNELLLEASEEDSMDGLTLREEIEKIGREAIKNFIIRYRPVLQTGSC